MAGWFVLNFITALSADHEVAENFFHIFASLSNEHDVTAKQSYVTDEIRSFWHCLISSLLVGSDDCSTTGFKETTFT